MIAKIFLWYGIIIISAYGLETKELIRLIDKKNEISPAAGAAPRPSQPVEPNFSSAQNTMEKYAALDRCPFSLDQGFVAAVSELKGVAEALFAEKNRCLSSTSEATTTASGTSETLLALISEIRNFDALESEYFAEREGVEFEQASKLEKTMRFETDLISRIGEMGAGLLVDPALSVMEKAVDRSERLSTPVADFSKAGPKGKKSYEDYRRMSELRTLRAMKADLVFEFITSVNGLSGSLRTIPKECYKKSEMGQIVGNLITQASKVLSLVPNEVGAIAKVTGAVSSAVTTLVGSLQYMMEKKVLSDIEEIVNTKALQCIYWKFEQIHCAAAASPSNGGNLRGTLIRQIVERDSVAGLVGEFGKVVSAPLRSVHLAIAEPKVETGRKTYPWQSDKKSQGRRPITIDRKIFHSLLTSYSANSYARALSFLYGYRDRYLALRTQYADLDRYTFEITLLELLIYSIEDIMQLSQQDASGIERLYRYERFMTFVATLPEDTLFVTQSKAEGEYFNSDSDLSMLFPSLSKRSRNSSDLEEYFNKAWQAAKASKSADDFLLALSTAGLTIPNSVATGTLVEIFYTPIDERRAKTMAPELARQKFASQVLPFYLEYEELFSKDFGAEAVDLVNFLALIDAVGKGEFQSGRYKDSDDLFLSKRSALIAHLMKRDYLAGFDNGSTHLQGPTLDALVKLQKPFRSIMFAPIINSMVQTFVQIFGEFAYYTQISRFWGHMLPDVSTGKSAGENWQALAAYYQYWMSLTWTPFVDIYSLAVYEGVSYLLMPKQEKGYASDAESMVHLKNYYNQQCLVFGNFLNNSEWKILLPQLNGLMITGEEIYQTLCFNDYFRAEVIEPSGITRLGQVATKIRYYDPMNENVCRVFQADNELFLLSY